MYVYPEDFAVRAYIIINNNDNYKIQLYYSKKLGINLTNFMCMYIHAKN